MKTLYLMCGLSFSGKTTLARKIVERLQCAYISLDNINADVVVDDVNIFGGYVTLGGLPLGPVAITQWLST